MNQLKLEVDLLRLCWSSSPGDAGSICWLRLALFIFIIEKLSYWANWRNSISAFPLVQNFHLILNSRLVASSCSQAAIFLPSNHFIETASWTRQSSITATHSSTALWVNFNFPTRPSTKCWFHTRPACFVPYRFLINLRQWVDRWTQEKDTPRRKLDE